MLTCDLFDLFHQEIETIDDLPGIEIVCFIVEFDGEADDPIGLELLDRFFCFVILETQPGVFGDNFIQSG